ncbi:MAG: cytochrome c [Chloroflexi bacterium]|nr:cytochrome c [Chloroflexota bacterium]
MRNKRRVLIVLGTAASLVILIVMLSVAVAGASPAADVAKGKAAWDRVCAGCHGAEGLGGLGPPLGPDVIFFKEVGLPQDILVGLLIQATRERPPNAKMPVLNPGVVSDAEVADIADYLWSLTPAPARVIPLGNAQAGAAPYAANCASCHGARGEGGAGPPVALMAAGLKAVGLPDAVMHALVRLATRSGSLPNMPAFTPAQLSDAQLADIAAFIVSLAPTGPPPGAAPAPPAPAGGTSSDNAMPLEGTVSGVLTDQRVWYRFEFDGIGSQGLVMNFAPADVETDRINNLVRFRVWTTVCNRVGECKLTDIGGGTRSGQPLGVKYWRTGGPARTFFVEVINDSGQTIRYALANAGTTYPPRGLEIP